MQNETGDSFFLERALFLAENFISRSSMHQNLFFLARKRDRDERKLLMFQRHTLFSTIRQPQLAAGHVSVLLKNRQLFSGGGLRESCNIFVGNRSAHGVYNSKWFGMCAFRLKKGAVVRKLLHRKVGKVPKSGCVRVVG
jgi:hypothetical protein